MARTNPARLWARAAGLVLVLGTASVARPVHAAPTAGDSSAALPRVRLFLDCDEFQCDFTFLKQELAWVDWVRNRQDADVYVLLTTRDTAGGGTEAMFYVTRPHGGGPASDTLRVFSRAEASDDEDRRLLLRTLQAILARDFAERSEGAGLTITMKSPHASAAAPAMLAKDPWNAWVMRLSGNGFFNGQRTFRNLNTFGNVSASRVVETSKVSVSGFGSYSEQRFDSPRFVGIQRSWGANARAVKTLGPRWSLGGRSFVNASRFSNQRRVIGGGPAVEYDVYPYAESSRRQLTLAYDVSVRRVLYNEITLYGKTEETLFVHGCTARLAFTQPWGTVGIGPQLSQYLHDTTKYRVTLSTEIQLKLLRGFSFNLSGFAARIRDQLALPRGAATDPDVLLQQRQLATSYQYFGSVGISYTFGSITNNVVNPRLSDVYGSF